MLLTQHQTYELTDSQSQIKGIPADACQRHPRNQVQISRKLYFLAKNDRHLIDTITK